MPLQHMQRYTKVLVWFSWQTFCFNLDLWLVNAISLKAMLNVADYKWSPKDSVTTVKAWPKATVVFTFGQFIVNSGSISTDFQENSATLSRDGKMIPCSCFIPAWNCTFPSESHVHSLFLKTSDSFKQSRIKTTRYSLKFSSCALKQLETEKTDCLKLAGEE